MRRFTANGLEVAFRMWERKWQNSSAVSAFSAVRYHVHGGNPDLRKNLSDLEHHGI